MGDRFVGRVGSALTWKTVQLVADQGVSLLRFLVLARLLAPEDFGLLAIATVAVDLLLALTNVGLQPALVQLRSRDRRHYDAAWTVGSLRGLLLSVLLFVGSGPIAAIYGEPAATPLLQLIALRPLLSGVASPRMADLERELNFKALALMTVSATVVQTIVAVALAPTLGVFAVVVGMLGGTAVFTASSYIVVPHRPRVRLDRVSSGPVLRFGRWVLATSIIGIVGEAALRGLISRKLGAPELGLYYVAARFAYLPSGVVTEIVGSIAFPLHARLRDAPEKAADAFRMTLRSLLALLLPAYLVLIALAPLLTRDILGARWQGAAPVIVFLAAAAVIGLVADAVFPMMNGRGKPERVTIMLAIRTVVLLILAWPLASAFGVAGAAAATLAAEIPVQILAATFARGTVPKPFSGVGRVVGAACVAGGAGAIGGLAVAAALRPPIGAIAAAITAAVTAPGTLWILDRALGLRLVEQLTDAFPVLRRLLRGS
jgi:lipopolysaccharide exporter